MEELHLSPLAVTHLLQHTLRSLCIHDNSQWVYAVFWRILPRNYPPPKWDGQGAYDRSRGNRRNWILVWEDGFCNFSASTGEMNNNNNSNCEFQPYHQGLQPELFFKMSHEIYNYGEGLIGKVAADHSHKWIHKEPNDQEINFLSSWHNSADSHPRTWEAQFQSGIKTIVLIAVREGVVQLGAVHKVIEDLSYVVLLRKKFSYIESIPGVLLPHPSSSAFPMKMDAYTAAQEEAAAAAAWPYTPQAAADHFYEHFNNQVQVPFKVTPSMSSLEALLSKLPSVVPPPHHGDPAVTAGATTYCDSQSQYLSINQRPPVEFMGIIEHNNNNNNNNKLAKQEINDEHDNLGESSSSISAAAAAAAAAYRRHQFEQQQQQHHHDLNVSSSRMNDGFFE